MKKEIKLNLGCGVHLLKDFINIDNSFTFKQLQEKKGIFKFAKIEKGAKFIKTDMAKLPFDDNSIDYIECLEAIEHIPYNKVSAVIREMHRVLKKGAKAVIFTTDFDDIAQIWMDHIKGKEYNADHWKLMLGLIYGLQITEGEYHRSLFNPTFFNGLLQACGFTKFKMVVYPRGTFPPKFRGAKWPKTEMACAFILVTATKT